MIIYHKKKSLASKVDVVTYQSSSQVAAREAESRRLSYEKESLQSKEDYINSFLERLEGETLGRMLEYLSSELTDSATVTRARDMMTDDAEETSEEIRQQEQEHIFAEIVKVTTVKSSFQTKIFNSIND